MLHWAFDTVAGCLAILYVRDFLLREVELWRQRKHADIEMERIAANANARLGIIFEQGKSTSMLERQAPYTTHDGAVITEWKRKAGSAGATAVSHATSVDDKGILSCAADPKEP